MLFEKYDKNDMARAFSFILREGYKFPLGLYVLRKREA